MMNLTQKLKLEVPSYQSSWKIERITDKKKILEILNYFHKYFPDLLEHKVNYTALFEKIAQHAIILVAKDTEKILGFVAFYANNIQSKTAYITLIAVDKNYRGQHVASNLIKTVESIAKENNFIEIKLEVNIKNTPAKNLYSHIGFIKAGDAILQKTIYMSKVIS